MLLTALACRSVLEPLPLPAGAREFTPEAVFRDWWHEMELCSGRAARYDDVTWYVVPGEAPFRVPTHDYPVAGYWDAAANRIVVLQYLPERRAPTIRHESLHAILRQTDHPRAYFEARCGDVINGPESPANHRDGSSSPFAAGELEENAAGWHGPRSIVR